MMTERALSLLDGLGPDDETRAADVRTQVALVRSIVDTIDRHRGSDPLKTDLDDQLGEEIDRLARMIARSGDGSA
jgi:hypothetical protein